LFTLSNKFISFMAEQLFAFLVRHHLYFIKNVIVLLAPVPMLTPFLYQFTREDALSLTRLKVFLFQFIFHVLIYLPILLVCVFIIQLYVFQLTLQQSILFFRPPWLDDVSLLQLQYVLSQFYQVWLSLTILPSI